MKNRRTLSVLLAVALSVATTGMQAQTYMPVPPHTVIANPNDRSANAHPIPFDELIKIINPDALTKIGDTDYTIKSTDRVVATDSNHPFASSHTWTLPPAASRTAGQPLYIADLGSTITGSRTLTIMRATYPDAADDRINGSPSSVTINITNGAYILISDGYANWLAQPLGAFSGGTVTAITAGFGLALSSGANCTISCTASVALTNTPSNSLTADVALNNISTYFDGPSVNVAGVAGRFFAVGMVTLIDTGATAAIDCRLWDGTTVVAAGRTTEFGINSPVTMSLSGFFLNPAGNIRISCKDAGNTTGKILANVTNNGNKDSTLNVLQVQ